MKLWYAFILAFLYIGSAFAMPNENPTKLKMTEKVGCLIPGKPSIQDRCCVACVLCCVFCPLTTLGYAYEKCIDPIYRRYKNIRYELGIDSEPVKEQ